MNYLMPHSDEYFSRLNNLFLFEVKDISILNCLSHIFSRDGIFPLVKFFWDHPTPDQFFKKIIIHQSCYFTIPKAWNGNVLFYRDQSLPPSGHMPKTNNLFLSGLANKDCVDIQKMKKNLSIALHQYDFEKVYLSLYNNNWKERDQHLEEEGFYFEIVKELIDIFGKRLEFLKWSEITNNSFPNCYFHDLCTSPFWYNDSYVKHSVLSKGAALLDLTSKPSFQDEEIIHFEQLSPYHGYEIFQGRHQAQTAIEKDNKEQHNILKSMINDNDIDTYIENLKAYASYLRDKYIGV